MTEGTAGITAATDQEEAEASLKRFNAMQDAYHARAEALAAAVFAERIAANNVFDADGIVAHLSASVAVDEAKSAAEEAEAYAMNATLDYIRVKATQVAAILLDR